VNIQQNISEYKVKNLTDTPSYHSLVNKNRTVLNFYTLAICCSVCLLLCRAFAHFTFAGRASVALHKSMVLSVVNATMKFFDLHHLGNILNRFAKDLGTVDETLPLNIYECLRVSFLVRKRHHHLVFPVDLRLERYNNRNRNSQRHSASASCFSLHHIVLHQEVLSADGTKSEEARFSE
jgi:ABC-type multidrug transport system fused ATPase/permease subunit